MAKPNMAQMLSMLSGLSDNEEPENKPMPTEEGQIAQLQEFIGPMVEQAKQFKVGDRVLRNNYGKLRYKFPAEKQVALVSRVFDERFDEKGQVVNAEIIIMERTKHCIIGFTVNLCYFEPYKAAQ